MFNNTPPFTVHFDFNRTHSVDQRRVVFASEESNFRHLYCKDLESGEVWPLTDTRKDFEVKDGSGDVVLGGSGNVFASCTAVTPMRNHLFSFSRDHKDQQDLQGQ